jgi:hypothetical protein
MICKNYAQQKFIFVSDNLQRDTLFYTTTLTNIVSANCSSCLLFYYLCTLNFHLGKIGPSKGPVNLEE